MLRDPHLWWRLLLPASHVQHSFVAQGFNFTDFYLSVDDLRCSAITTNEQGTQGYVQLFYPGLISVPSCMLLLKNFPVGAFSSVSVCLIIKV